MKRPASSHRLVASRDGAASEQPMKRVNSKEEIGGEELMLSKGFAEVQVGSPRPIRPLTKRVSMRLLSKESFENAMRLPGRLAAAIKIAKKNHCDEDLLLFGALIEWEQAKPGGRKDRAEKILSTFIMVDAPHEVCVSSSLRNKLLERQNVESDQYFDELKSALVAELRLMPQVVHALLEV